jgi:hypothetical protein
VTEWRLARELAFKKVLAIRISPRIKISARRTDMNDKSSQVEKLGGESLLLQRVGSLIPPDKTIPTDRFQLLDCQPAYLFVKQTRGEQRGRILMFARHLVDDVPPLGCADHHEWCILLRAPYTLEEPGCRRPE